jgi:hypothetical protein
MTQRKSVIALVLTALVGAATAIAFGPSLVVGEFAAWQWLAPPFALLLATALAARPWLSGRFTGPRALLHAGAALLAFVGLAAVGVWSRATEVPDRGPPFDVAAFRRAEPTPEANEAGRRIARIARAFAEQTGSSMQTLNLIGQLNSVVSIGQWPTEAPDLRADVAKAAAGSWHSDLSAAVRLPVGHVETLNAAFSGDNHELLRSVGFLGILETAEAMRLADAGDIAGSLDRSIVALRYSRHLRARAGVNQWMVALSIETNALRQIVATFDRPGATDDQLHRALSELVEHERELPDAADAVRADYSILADLLASDRFDFYDGGAFRKAVQLAPWERERQERILNAVYAGYLRTLGLTYADALARAPYAAGLNERYALLAGWSPESGERDTATAETRRAAGWTRTAYWRDSQFGASWIVPQYEFSDRVRRRAAILQVALALYERTRGKPAETLDALVPDLIPAVPSDPVDGRPFRYRVSTGETVEAYNAIGPRTPDRPTVLKPGQGVVWSVGPDCTDQGGARETLEPQFAFAPRPPTGDLIFAVPKPEPK